MTSLFKFHKPKLNFLIAMAIFLWHSESIFVFFLLEREERHEISFVALNAAVIEPIELLFLKLDLIELHSVNLGNLSSHREWMPSVFNVLSSFLRKSIVVNSVDSLEYPLNSYAKFTELLPNVMFCLLVSAHCVHFSFCDPVDAFKC